MSGPCRECGQPDAHLCERRTMFCGAECADRFFQHDTVRALRARIAELEEVIALMNEPRPPDPPDEPMHLRTNGPVHTWFELSYCSYLVIPRLALQEMPVAWQRRLVDLLEEGERLGMTTPSGYHVTRRTESGRFRSDPWANYRRGTVAAARAADARAEGSEP